MMLIRVIHVFRFTPHFAVVRWALRRFRQRSHVWRSAAQRRMDAPLSR